MAKWGDGDLIEGLTEAIANWQKAFKKYGRHLYDCRGLLHSKYDCSCGFNETLKLMNQKELRIPEVGKCKACQEADKLSIKACSEISDTKLLEHKIHDIIINRDIDCTCPTEGEAD